MAALDTFGFPLVAGSESPGASWLFHRIARRRARLKRRLDCGHVIDGTEPYRYEVGRLAGTTGLVQSLSCEFCARADDSY